MATEAQPNGSPAVAPPAAPNGSPPAATAPDADRAQLVKEAAAGRKAAQEADELRRQLAARDAERSKETETRAEREKRLEVLRETDPRAWLKEVSGRDAAEIAALFRKQPGKGGKDAAPSPEIVALMRKIEALEKGIAERDQKTEAERTQTEQQRVAAEEANVYGAVSRHLKANEKKFPHLRAAMAMEGTPTSWKRELRAFANKNPDADEEAVCAAYEQHFLTRDEKRSTLLGTSKRAPSKGAPQATATERATDGQTGNPPRTLTNGLSAERGGTKPPGPRSQREAEDEREERIKRAIAVANALGNRG